MADTDEPFYQREANTVIQKTCGKNDGSSMSTSSYESKQFMESKTFMSSSSNQRREESSSSFISCPTVQTPASKTQMQRSCYEKSYMSSAPTNTTRSFKNDKVRDLNDVFRVECFLFFT